MNIKYLCLFLFFSLSIFSKSTAQRVVLLEGYAVIDCSGMPEGSIKSSQELFDSKMAQSAGGMVRRHVQCYSGSQQGSEVEGLYGTPNVTLYINEKVSRKFCVSPDYINIDGSISATEVEMKWSQASGWGVGADGDDLGNIPPSVPLTGCAAYGGKSSASSERGLWRLPTARELLIIYSLKGQLSASSVVGFKPFSSSIYWSATEGISDYSWSVNFDRGYVSNGAKYSPDRVRCVRDL